MKDGVSESGLRRTVTVPEAGVQLGISRNAAYEAAARGEIPTLRIGKRLVVPKAALDRMLAGEAA
jgi:excisionase family DNA binding protein